MCELCNAREVVCANFVVVLGSSLCRVVLVSELFPTGFRLISAWFPLGFQLVSDWFPTDFILVQNDFRSEWFQMGSE